MEPHCLKLLAVLGILVYSITLSSCATTKVKHEDKSFTKSSQQPVTAATTAPITSQLSEAVKGIGKPQTPFSPLSTQKRQFRNDLSKRKPKFGLNFTMPGLTMNSMDVDTFLGPTGLFGGTSALSQNGSPNVLGDLATLAAPLILLKGVSIAALKVLKTIILPPIFFLVLLAFLIAGAIYFASAIRTGNDTTGFDGNTGFGTTFSRNTYDFEQPVYDALDNGHYKYNTYANSYSHNYDTAGASNNGGVLAEPEYTTYTYQPYTSRYSSYNNYIYPNKSKAKEVRIKGT